MSIRIDDLEDERLAPFRNVRDRDLSRAHEGAFLVEGEVSLPVLLGQDRHRVRALLLAESRVDKLGAVLARVPQGVPIYLGSQDLVEAIVGFPMHRGVLALAARAPAVEPAALLAARPARVLGLCGITNHDNVGGIFRNAAAFGAGAVLLDRDTCDPLYRKAVRVSVGGTIAVPFAQVADEGALVDVLMAHGYAVLALGPRGDRVIGRDPPPPGPVALLLGTEGPGLSKETLARVPSARIPMAPGWDSLNVATASGIALAWLSAR